jgi:streptogramin lyase
MFQVANRSDEPSPWLVDPASNKTVWLVTWINNPLRAQLVNFTMISPTVGLSQPVANLTNTVPSDIFYDRGRVWIIENDSLEYYDLTTREIIVAKTFPNAIPQFMANDSYDNLWLTLLNTDQIVEYDPSTGTTYSSTTPSSNAGLQGITVSPFDGSVWFAEAYTGRIGHLIPCSSSSCPITEFSPPAGMTLQGLIQVVVDKNGVVWFTVHDGNEFGSFNPSTGEWQLFPIGYCPDSYVDGCETGLPNAIDTDASGEVWFSEHIGGRIARYDPASGNLVEYMMPTSSAICTKDCTPYSWWMWPGENGLVWFAAFGLGEIGYVNSTVPIPLAINSQTSVTVNQGESVNIPVSATFVRTTPSFGASITSQDAPSNPAMIIWSSMAEHVSSQGTATSTITISASWSSTVGSRFVAFTVYDDNLTVNTFVKIDVVASLALAGTTIGFASGISVFAAAFPVITRYSKRHSNGTVPDQN